MNRKQLVGYLLKHLIYIRSRFGTRLKKDTVVCLCKLLALLVSHLFFIILIWLRAHKYSQGILNGRVLIDVLHPFLKVLKWLSVAKTEGDKDSFCIFVVHGSKSSESFFSGSIPQLYFDVKILLCLGWGLHLLRVKLSSHGHIFLAREVAAYKPFDEARFSDALVANNDHFESGHLIGALALHL